MLFNTYIFKWIVTGTNQIDMFIWTNVVDLIS